MTTVLSRCIELAVKAGDAIMTVYARDDDRGVSLKSDSSPVTDADRAADSIIVDGLHEAHFTILDDCYAVLSEESADDGSRLAKDWCFVVDPLDGTKEFVARMPEFTVNIALVHRSRPVLGVVYAPCTRELYYACDGRGAFKNILRDPDDVPRMFDENDRIRVSARTDKLICMHSRFHLDDRTRRLIERNKDRISEVVTAGSALKACRIAEGRADVYYRFGPTMEWDTAASQIIVTEAGGIMRSLPDQEIIVYNRKDTCNHNGFYVINKDENKLKGAESDE